MPCHFWMPATTLAQEELTGRKLLATSKAFQQAIFASCMRLCHKVRLGLAAYASIWPDEGAAALPAGE